MVAGARSQDSWLFGPLPDLAIGCGLAYAGIFAIFSVAGPGLIASQPVVLAALITLLLGGPHYGGTLLRVYERRADRQSYAIFSIWATLAVAIAFVVSVHDFAIGAWFFTLYITWSPWHYTGQNYGLAVMFLRRRGVEIHPSAKRLLYASFFFSFAITFLVLHGSTEASGYLPNPVTYDEPGVSLRPLRLPYAFTAPALLLASGAYLATLVGAIVALRRSGTWREMGPSLTLMATQALWFSIPFSVTFWHLHTGLDPLDSSVSSRYVVWIAVGHASQYLWVTSYYARSSPGWKGFTRYFGKTLAAGAAIWTIPAILFAPDRLGDPEYAGGLALLVAAGVNLHHFILDGAIWKLRNSRVAGVLIRSSPEAADGAGDETPWVRHAVWAVCAGAALIAVSTIILEHSSFTSALRARDYDRARTTLDRMAWFGQDDSRRRLRVGDGLLRTGDLDAAEAEYERSLSLKPSVRAWLGIAAVREGRSDWAGVLDARSAALELDPTDVTTAAAAVRAHYALGERDPARAIMEALLATDPESARAHANLAATAREAGDLEWAARHYRRALELQPDRHSAANNLAWILATAPDPALRDPDESIRLARDALGALEAPDPNYLDTLATGYAAAGRFDEAAATATRAIALASEAGDEAQAEALRASLEAYRAGRTASGSGG
jgi:tetratricopeptide (TPR) repeat protein